MENGVKKSEVKPLVSIKRIQEWGRAPYEFFDEDAYFEEKVQPLIDQVTDLCAERGIPILVYSVPKFVKEGRDRNKAATMQGVFVSPGRCPGEILAMGSMEFGFTSDEVPQLLLLLGAQEKKKEVTLEAHPDLKELVG